MPLGALQKTRALWCLLDQKTLRMISSQTGLEMVHGNYRYKYIPHCQRQENVFGDIASSINTESL